MRHTVLGILGILLCGIALLMNVLLFLTSDTFGWRTAGLIGALLSAGWLVMSLIGGYLTYQEWMQKAHPRER